MQMYNKNDFDARSFPQIWETLTPAEQMELRFQLTRNGDCSRTSVFHWSKGVTPVSLGMRKKVASVMKSVLGLNVSHLTLFPMR